MRPPLLHGVGCRGISEILMPSEYQLETAPLLLPHLVRAAQRRETPTYGELGKAIGRHHRPIRHVLGYIRDDIVLPRGLPMITAIVVNDNTRLPGDKFLPEGTEDLTEEEYKHEFEVHRDRVFDYGGWDDLLEELGLTPISKTLEDLNKEVGSTQSFRNAGEARVKVKSTGCLRTMWPIILPSSTWTPRNQGKRSFSLYPVIGAT